MFTLHTLSVLPASRCAAQAELSVSAVLFEVVDDGAPPGARVVRWRR